MLGLGIDSTMMYGFSGMDLKQATSSVAPQRLALWLKNDTGVTAGKWTDSSGYNNHVSQSTEGNQAAVSGGGLDFERNESDHYDLTSTITVGNEAGFCIAAVITLETASNGTLLSKDAFDQFQVKSTDEFRFRSDTSNVTTDFVFSDDGSSFPVSTKMLILLNRSADGERFTFFKNGTQLTPDSDTSTNEAEGENPGGLDINVLGAKEGSSQFFDGIIHELAFWNGALTTQEIVDVNYYLKSVHGL